ncbi:hypothetical protein KAFR_0I02400 [Kazachstania africana CBS 2517]|uniref:Sm protein B n=1 Tax=Kazachstania africana (strain ATCC 22294 / BCRC 22015 / CBS 2517 / CECT 1963 / NBRC 1671 / NRRL Y-8276) TaxID=1071382 RepID=H2B069_KAZAF|nr:hypothetical protein KAFR_0I02400 [Kazachstania africana CBS 2517]CCF60019.1 hypothetical protein KAFR_0I02400 [Kazachstania africana CBS 2517]
MSATSKVKQNSRLSDLINYRLRVIAQDGRVYIGELLAFDKHMNLILNDCVEERIPKTQQNKIRKTSDDKMLKEAVKIEKRTLGLIILRGEHVLSTVIEDKPLLTKKERLAKTKKEEKQLLKQQKQNKKGKVTKPPNSSTPTQVTSSRFNNVPQQTKKFQPPPGFKRGKLQR